MNFMYEKLQHYLKNIHVESHYERHWSLSHDWYKMRLSSKNTLNFTIEKNHPIFVVIIIHKIDNLHL